MRTFWQIAFLPIVWMALTGDFSAGNFLVGVLIGTLAKWVMAPVGKSTPVIDSLRKMLQWAGFFFFFIYELTLASFRITWDILTPRHRLRPAILGIPLDITSDAEITLLANLITLTPGTLSLDVSSDRRVLYIYAMYVEDTEKFKTDVKRRLEHRVKELYQ